MKISARADYAVRACVELAARGGELVPAEVLAGAQQVPHRFLEGILTDLRRAGVVTSQRGSGGGYRLARPAAKVSLADVVRAVEGPLVFVRDTRPADLAYDGSSRALLDVWVALRAAVRSVLEETSLAAVVSGELPAHVRAMTAPGDAWANP
jgi:Rrf2 family protein